MNFLILGSEIPDYSHPVLLNYNPPEDPNRPLTEDEKMIKMVHMIQSNTYTSDLEKLRLYYQEKLKRLQWIHNQYLSNYAVFNTPAAGLGAWIKLNKEQRIAAVLPLLAKTGIYNPDDNPQLDPQMPLVGIRAGFGSPNIEAYERTFGILAAHFKASDQIAAVG